MKEFVATVVKGGDDEGAKMEYQRYSYPLPPSYWYMFNDENPNTCSVT